MGKKKIHDRVSAAQKASVHQNNLFQTRAKVVQTYKQTHRDYKTLCCNFDCGINYVIKQLPASEVYLFSILFYFYVMIKVRAYSPRQI